MQISPRALPGKINVVTTIVTSVTGFGIFQHGGFGKPHALSIITLAGLGVAGVADRSTLFGRASRGVETISYSATRFFHFIHGITETSTRLPLASPLVANAHAPALQVAPACCTSLS